MLGTSNAIKYPRSECCHRARLSSGVAGRPVESLSPAPSIRHVIALAFGRGCDRCADRRVQGWSRLVAAGAASVGAGG
jgi:hypothetical protein